MDANINQVAVSHSTMKSKKETNKKPRKKPLTANSLCNFQIYLEMVWLDASYKIRVTPVTENEWMDIDIYIYIDGVKSSTKIDWITLCYPKIDGNINFVLMLCRRKCFEEFLFQQ